MDDPQDISEQETWYVQVEDGSVFGPVDIDTLRLWCQEGRIEPESRLSQDQEDWIEAQCLPDLDMVWHGYLDDGTRIGPFHSEWISGLAENGVLSPGTRLEHRDSGETLSVAAFLGIPFEEPEEQAVTEDSETAQKAPDAMDDDTDEPSQGLDEIPAETSEEGSHEADVPVQTDVAPDPSFPDSEETPDETLQEAPLSNRLAPLQRSATEARQQLVEARETLKQLRADHTLLKDAYARLEEECELAQTASLESEKKWLQEQERADGAQTEIENLKAQLNQVNDHYDRLQLENQQQFEQIDALRAEILKNEQHFKKKINALQERLEARARLMGDAMQALLRDSDMRAALPESAAKDESENAHRIESLKESLQQVQQQLEQERRQKHSPIANHTPRSDRNVVDRKHRMGLVLLAFVIVVLGLALGPLRGCRSKTETSEHHDNEQTNAVLMDNGSDVPSLPRADEMDLQPDTTLNSSARRLQDNLMTTTSWPELNLPRTTLTPSPNGLRLVFHDGLFAVAARLTPQAEETLILLAEQLQGKLNGRQLMIEGHTDATPIVSSRSRFVDNFALGMARAEEVKRFLTTRGELPEEAMRTASAGESSPPYSNDTEADRMRNRTVIITLTKNMSDM